MKYQETDKNGSFTALGTAFVFNFDAENKTLDVSRAGRNLTLFQRVILSDMFATDPLEYVQLYEKTSQIKALKYSNNGSTNLEKTLTDAMLMPILDTTAQISGYAFNLRKGAFTSFRKDFLDHQSHIRDTVIDETRTAGGAIFYAARLATKKGNAAASRSSTLHAAISYLSDKVIQDIIAREFSYNQHDGIYRLMATASILSTLSLTLNDRFDPKRRAKLKTTPIFAKMARDANSYLKTDIYD